MELECSRLARVVLPGVRASVAGKMSKEYHYNQQTIADMLGVDQVAVSKYLNGKYSKKVADMKRFIESKGLDRKVLMYASDPNSRKMSGAIDTLCAEIAAKNR